MAGPTSSGGGSAPGGSGAGNGSSGSAAAASLAELPHVFRKGARAVFEMPTIRDAIQLTDEEQALFKELLDATKQAGLSTTLRCAGGWVRDKLMGRSSLDIDIALDDLMGREFADRVNEYLRAHGEETHHVAVIMSNPEQSKHLETARMKVRGIWIDLVNLRSEEYAHHSRIPTMTFGTPEEDAFRRDFTINSLFYNINTGLIEDFTKQGLADLRAGIIRTPMPPKETFMDDPLRVLRAVRFASRFGFELEESLLEAAADDEVREALAHKVSRERVGAELEGMLHGPDPVMALRLLHRLRIFPAVFALPPGAGDRLSEDAFGGAACALAVEAFDEMQAWKHPEFGFDQDSRRRCMLAAVLLPLADVQVPAAKGKRISAASHVVREALKWKAKDAEAVDVIHSTAPELIAVYKQLQGQPDGVPAPEQLRVKLGLCIRKLKQLWPAGCVTASLLHGNPAARPSDGEDLASVASAAAAVPVDAAEGEVDAEGTQRRLDFCEALLQAATAYGIAGCWQWKPLLDGKQVMQAVGMKSGGPALGKLMEAAVEWQLAHPSGTAEECRAWLEREHRAAMDAEGGSGNGAGAS